MTTVTPELHDDGPAAVSPTTGARNWAVVRLAISGVFHGLVLLAVLALTASSNGAQTTAELLGTSTQTAETGLKVVAALLTFAVLDYLHSAVRMFGPHRLYVVLNWVSLVLAYAVVTACAAVLAFFVGDVSNYLGDSPDNIRTIAAGVLALYLWFGTTTAWDRIRQCSVGHAAATGQHDEAVEAT